MWQTIKELFACFNTSKKGQGMVEYGLVVSLMSIVAIAVMISMGPQITDMFDDGTGVDEEAVGERQATLSSTIYD